MKNKETIFFDLDGTILKGVNAERAFVSYLFFNRYIGISQFFKAIFFMIRWVCRFKLRIFVLSKALFSGTSFAQVANLGREFAKKELVKFINPVLIERIKGYNEANANVYLITGSIEFLGQAVAEYLNIKNVIGARLAVRKGMFTEEPPSRFPHSTEKLIIVKDICSKLKIKIEDCAAYGNSIHDLALLSAVGKPVAVTPERKLWKVAKERNWEIIT